MTRMMLLLLAVMALPLVAADPSAPAEFTVTDTVAWTDPGAFTATMGGVPGVPSTLWSGGHFEPHVFRTKLYAAGDSSSELIVDPHGWSPFQMTASGFWTGAEVRAYRIRNGAMELVRQATVQEHNGEGWLMLKTDDRRLVTGTEYYDRAANMFRPGVPLWITVAAVTEDGRIGPKAEPARFMVEEYQKRVKTPKYKRTELKRRTEISQDPSLPAPQGMQAEIVDGYLKATWKPVAEAKGYNVYLSAYDPATHRGHRLLLGDGPAIKQGDLIFLCQQHDNMSRAEHLNPLHWQRTRSEYGDESETPWRKVAHPGPLPAEFQDHGALCLEVTTTAEKTYSYGKYSYAGPEQTWYTVLDPAVEYVAEGWMRFEGSGQGQVELVLSKYKQLDMREQIGSDWQFVRFPFRVPEVMQGGVGRTDWHFKGDGTWHIDALKVYRADDGYQQAPATVVEKVRESGMRFIRFHSQIKTDHSYTMAMLLDGPGIMGYKGWDKHNNENNLMVDLGFCKQSGVNPWLQIEMHMSDQEWLAFAEWFCAPYDPASDTPEAKPWAHLRYRLGQQEPWIEVFDEVMFEVSNEVWNGLFNPWVFMGNKMVDEVTGEQYSSGQLHGLLQERIIAVLRSSPYWTDAVEDKVEYVIGGWASQEKDTGYGAAAIQLSPNTDHLQIAGYNGGWDEGEMAAEMTPEALARGAAFWLQNFDRSNGHMLTRQQLIDEGRAHPYQFGTYEAGPGYALNGLNGAVVTSEQAEAQNRVGKSLAVGTSTLDAFLGRAMIGYSSQNFFTLSFRHPNWTSHQPLHLGGDPYPSWLGLQLYNNEGTGDLLQVEMQSAPTWDFPKFKRRREVTDGPLIAVYASRKGEDRLNVFVISRKVDGVYDDNGDGKVDEQDDGYTPVTLHLPISSADSVTMHAMTGDPRWHNMYEDLVQLSRKDGIGFARDFRLTSETTGLEQDGMPPASVLLYVFEGCRW